MEGDRLISRKISEDRGPCSKTKYPLVSVQALPPQPSLSFHLPRPREVSSHPWILGSCSCPAQPPALFPRRWTFLNDAFVLRDEFCPLYRLFRCDPCLPMRTCISREQLSVPTSLLVSCTPHPPARHALCTLPAAVPLPLSIINR